jgi:hypothetical protein
MRIRTGFQAKERTIAQYHAVPGQNLVNLVQLLGAQRCDRCARQFPYMGLTLRILDRQGDCSPVAGQSLLLSAKFGIEVAARQLKQRICRVFFNEWRENAERFLILLIVAMQIQRKIKTRNV